MGYYSDPTAAKALSGINREFARLEKRAKKLCKLQQEGKLSPQALEKAQTQFKGIYRHVLNNALKESHESPPTGKPVGGVVGNYLYFTSVPINPTFLNSAGFVRIM